AQTIEEGYARLVAARKRDESLNEKLRALNTISEEGKPLREAVQRAREDLLRELERARSRAEELQKSCRKLPQLRKEQELQRARLAGLASRKTDLEAKKEQAQGIFEHIRHLEADNALLKGEMNGLKEKLDLLAPAQARCPLCGADLDPSAREQLESSYQTEGRSKADTYRSHQKTLEGLQGEHKALDGEVRSIEAGLQSEAAPEQARQLALEKEVREAEEAAAMLVEAEASRGELQQRWSSADFAPVETKRLRELEAEARELQYDAQGHRAAQEEMEETKGFEDRKHRLDEAERSIPMQKSDLDRALAEVSTRRQRLEAEQQRKQSLGAELASLPQVALRLEEAEGGLALQVSRKTRMQRDLVELEVKLRRLQDREREHGEKATRKKRALEEEQIYKELAEAFGKGGIQAQLIEYALPEIEVEANRLLGRMTDNRMHLKIDTQRPIKSRKEEMAETLVIEIADELGTRNYEMFSGGEAFRINLALRIALSKLLAHRAGAPLPTLIIDEGFGSQDTAGREKLVDAINSIQDDFEKIIVITHIEEMKDLFPVRINVIKTAEGSTIQVS
ncbi:MAG: SMC family ATPase, partial [Dehalococcoidia bacterium]